MGSLTNPISIGSVIAGGTPGSVLFVDASGTVGQDNANFSYSSVTQVLSADRFSSTVGNSNSVFGTDALNANTTGIQNSAMGVSALQSNTTGANNSAVGFDAGRFITGGVNPNQTSSNGIYIGAASQAFADGQTNEIVIGASATGYGSNTATLGNSSTTLTVLQGNLGIDGVSTFGTNAVGVLGLPNATAPTTSPAGMGQLYVLAGALVYRGSAGTVTTIAPA